MAYRIDTGYEDYFKVDNNSLQDVLIKVEDDFTALKEAIMSK